MSLPTLDGSISCSGKERDGDSPLGQEAWGWRVQGKGSSIQEGKNRVEPDKQAPGSSPGLWEKSESRKVTSGYIVSYAHSPLKPATRLWARKGRHYPCVHLTDKETETQCQGQRSGPMHSPPFHTCPDS